MKSSEGKERKGSATDFEGEADEGESRCGGRMEHLLVYGMHSIVGRGHQTGF